MAILTAADPRLGPDPDDPFKSPFPSSAAEASTIFNALMSAVDMLPNAPEGGVMAKLQAKAWHDAQRRVLYHRLTSPSAGGLATDVLNQVARIGPDGQVIGAFASVLFAATTNVNSMVDSAIAAGLELAENALSAIPILGAIFKAAISVGKFFAALAKKPPGELVLNVPWAAYSRDSDEDVINIILSEMMAGIDWTPAFAPALDWDQGFQLRTTARGDNTRAWGTFTQDGNLKAAGGIGMMPGTQKIGQVVQVATTFQGPTSRVDAVTDVGSFWPATAQFLTGAWEMAEKRGAGDMYKLRAGELYEAWGEYFGTMFDDAWGQWDGLSWEQKIYLSKALAPYVVAKTNNSSDPADWILGLYVANLNSPYVKPGIFKEGFEGFNPTTTYASVADAFILPALRAFQHRQKRMLAHSLACAFVRPVAVGDLPAFAAFEDRSPALDGDHDTWGEELRTYCLEMREILLTHPARKALAQPPPGAMRPLKARDVRDVDPKFADELDATTLSDDWITAGPQVAVVAAPLDAGQAVPDPAQLPGGGAPFAEETGRSKLWKGLAIGGGVLGVGALGVLGWRLTRDG